MMVQRLRSSRAVVLYRDMNSQERGDLFSKKKETEGITVAEASYTDFLHALKVKNAQNLKMEKTASSENVNVGNHREEIEIPGVPGVTDEVLNDDVQKSIRLGELKGTIEQKGIKTPTSTLISKAPAMQRGYVGGRNGNTDRGLFGKIRDFFR